MGTVTILPVAQRNSPEEAIKAASNENLKDVVILGTYKDGVTDDFIISSKMDRATALWLSEKLRCLALSVVRDV